MNDFKETGGSRHIYFSPEALERIKELDRGEASRICDRAIKEACCDPENLDMVDNQLKILNAEKEIIKNKLQILKEDEKRINLKINSVKERYNDLKEQGEIAKKTKEKRKIEQRIEEENKEKGRKIRIRKMAESSYRESLKNQYDVEEDKIDPLLQECLDMIDNGEIKGLTDFVKLKKLKVKKGVL